MDNMQSTRGHRLPSQAVLQGSEEQEATSEFYQHTLESSGSETADFSSSQGIPQKGMKKWKKNKTPLVNNVNKTLDLYPGPQFG